jgi:outer membrane protein, heavy metal efflux system
VRFFAASAFAVTFSLAACAIPVAAQPAVEDELVLGSELRVALRAPESLPVPPAGNAHTPVHLPPVAPADDAEVLTLADAEAQALAFHPALREAGGNFRAAQGNWLQSGLKPNPEIGYSGNEIGNEGSAGQQGGYVSQEFVTAGKLRLNRAVASREVFAAQQRLEIARQQVLTSVRIGYFELLTAKRMVALARQLSEVAAQSTAVSQQRLKALDIPRVSLLQSQVQSDTTALLEQQSTERLNAAARRFTTLIGAVDTQPQLDDNALLQPLPQFDWAEARDRILGESPQLTELRFDVDRARWAVDRASAGRVPNVSMMTGVAHDYATDDTIANVQVSMPLPVFDRNQGGIAQAFGELAAAQAALQEQELALEQKLTLVLRDYLTARQRVVKYSETILPVARESLDITSAGYREGELDYLAVLMVQQTYAETNLAYLRDLETAWKKWAEIKGLLVAPLGQDSN